MGIHRLPVVGADKGGGMKSILIFMWSVLSIWYIYQKDFGSLRFSIGAISGLIIYSICDYIVAKNSKKGLTTGK
jgi:hypothetical protein